MRGTTQSTAAKMTAKSQQSRPATSGNKRIATGANRQSAMDQKGSTAATFAATHTGPYLGSRSV